MTEERLDSNKNCVNEFFEAIRLLVARGNEARINNGLEPLTKVTCEDETTDDCLQIEHTILLDVERKPIVLKLALRLDEINGKAVFSGPAGFGLELRDVETFQEQLVGLSMLGHELEISYQWYFGLDPNGKESIEDVKKLIPGSVADLYMTSTEDLTTPVNFASRFMNTLGNLEPAFNEVLDTLMS